MGNSYFWTNAFPPAFEEGGEMKTFEDKGGHNLHLYQLWCLCCTVEWEKNFNILVHSLPPSLWRLFGSLTALHPRPKEANLYLWNQEEEKVSKRAKIKNKANNKNTKKQKRNGIDSLCHECLYMFHLVIIQKTGSYVVTVFQGSRVQKITMWLVPHTLDRYFHFLWQCWDCVRITEKRNKSCLMLK